MSNPIYGSNQPPPPDPDAMRRLAPEEAASIAVEETISTRPTSEWPRTEDRIDWPKKWSADEIAWVKREIIGEYLRDTGRCDCVCARHP